MSLSISFSGLGGSGKTTQINKISSYFKEEGFRVSIVILRNKFLWPKLAGFLSKKNVEKLTTNKNFSKITIKYIIRHFFYFFDFWRVYFFYIFPKYFYSDIIFIDRSFIDFLVELDLSFGKITFLSYIFYKLLPKPEIELFFDIPPEDSYNRKKESNLEFIVEQYKLYNLFIKKIGDNSIIRIYSREEIDETFTVLKDMILEGLRSGIYSLKFRFFNYFVFFNSSLVEKNTIKKIINWNFEDFLNYAQKNRFLWYILNNDLFLINKDLINKKLIEKISKIKFSGENILFKKNNTIKKINDIFNNRIDKNKWKLIKESEIEISKDVDLIFIDFESYNNARKILKNNFLGELIDLNRTKSDFIFNNDYFLPIDLHCDFSFNKRKYFDDLLFFTNENEANILSIISHSIAEMTVITLGDIIKIKKIINNNEINWYIIFFQTKKYHWHNLFLYWMTICNSSEDFVFPYNISVFFLFFDKIFNIDFNYKGLYNFFRAIRARKMNQIPFHPLWFKD